MSLAGSGLLLGARVRFLAATMLIGCSGGDDDAATNAPNGDAATSDVALDRSQGPGAADASRDRAPDRTPSAEGGGALADSPLSDSPADVQDELALCLRLLDPMNPHLIEQLSISVETEYLLAIGADCRVEPMLHGSVTVNQSWRNALYAWNLGLWGCPNSPPKELALLSGAFTQVTSADESLLIDLYLKVATKVLALSLEEVQALRREIEREAQSVPTTDAMGFAYAKCAGDAAAEADAPRPLEAGPEAAADVEAGTTGETSDDADATQDAVEADMPEATDDADGSYEGD